MVNENNDKNRQIHEEESRSKIFRPWRRGDKAQPFMDAAALPGIEEEEKLGSRLMHTIRNRNVVLLFVLMIAFTAMFVSATNLHLNATEGINRQEDSGSRRQIAVKTARGRILDRNGVELASSRDVNMLYWAYADLENEAFNEVLLDLAKTLESYDIEYGKAIDNYLDIRRMSFAMDDADMIYWQKNRNYLGLQDLPEGVESDYRDKRYVKTKARDFYDYLAYTRFGVDESYGPRDKERIVRLRFQIYLNNWSFIQGTPVLIARDIPDDLMTIFEEQNFRFMGAVTTTEPVRRYAEDAVYLAPVIGHVGLISAEQYAQLASSGYSPDDIVGKSGIELVTERYLHGESTYSVYNIWGKDGPEGNFVSEVEDFVPSPGDDVKLTIDMKVQKAAVESLAEMIDIYNNDNAFVGFPESSGAAVMIDLKNNGAVLAMASLPTFNPQDFIDMADDEDAADRVAKYLTDSEKIPMLNRAIALPKAPGSTFKIFTAAALLHSGTVNPYTQVFCPGYYEIDGMRFGCEDEHGYVDLGHAIAYSCNVYFYEKSVDMGIDDLSEMTTMLGLGLRSGIELYGESAGINASRESKIMYNQDPANQSWYPADTAQSSIGQGLNSLTVLQLARATGAIATGELAPVHIIDEVQAADGTVTMKAGMTSTQLNLNDALLTEVRDAMHLMTTDEMSTVRTIFETAPYQVAGKTGTAETLVANHGPTTDGLYVAFAPYDDPQVAVAVVIETGARGAATSRVARAMFDAYFSDEVYKIGDISLLPGIE